MVLVFGNHRLDLARRELRRAGELVAIEPRAFDLLAFLVQHRDRVVGKDDLLQGVWGGRIVSDSALTTRINAVRRALGDDGASQRLIRTVTGKGVRFVGEVTEAPEPAVTPADKPSIAVLPFVNLSGDPGQDYFVDGMVEEIITALGRIRWLQVIARNSSFAYKGKAVEVRQVARELGARYVLEGSVRRAGNRVRIAGQLIDAATGAQIWAERFDGALDNIFALQDEVASAVAGAVGPQLRLAEIERVRRKPADSLDAYDLNLRALEHANKPTKEGLALSVRLAYQSLEYDPACGPAMARIALSRGMQQLRHWIPAAGTEAEEGIWMARQAIAAAGDDPGVLDVSGLALSLLAGDNDAALSAIERAIALNPSFALAFGHRALVLAFMNRPEEAILSAHEAIRLSPREPAMFAFCSALALAHLTLGRYDEGLRWAEEALRGNSGAPALCTKLSLCGHLGRRKEASECLRRMHDIGIEPTVAALAAHMSKGLAAEVAARVIEGLRRAGVPEG
jgi:TolB-like protein